MGIDDRPAWQRALGKALMRLTGWTIEGQPTTEPRAVLVAYPHTSNWDFVVLLLMKWATGIQASFWGKDSRHDYTWWRKQAFHYLNQLF